LPRRDVGDKGSGLTGERQQLMTAVLPKCDYKPLLQVGRINSVWVCLKLVD
jgi:hypothetical protein